MRRPGSPPAPASIPTSPDDRDGAPAGSSNTSATAQCPVVALDVHTGQVITETIARNNADTFIRFLRLLNSSIAAHLDIHLVLDNGSSHTAKKTRSWLAAYPRFHIHWTPKHASWLNQVEIFSPRSPGVYYVGARSHRARTSATASTISCSKTTPRTLSTTAGPTTAPTQSRMNPRKINAVLH
ncbi:transposase [Streptomyces sp. CA-210063]|uniref:transposase n=1 Tax=Streptomyces sp. CA-210063 TaxID=2801029 RepID=UPI003FA6DA1E